MSALYDLLGYQNAAASQPYGWTAVDPAQLQNQLWGMLPRQTALQKAQQRRESACRWFATHYRKRAAESGVQAVARQMRKQGVPVDVAVSILATR